MWKLPAISWKIPKIFLWDYLHFFVFMFILAIFLFFLVKMRLESFELGYKIEQLEKEGAQLKEEISILASDLSYLRSSGYLLKMNEAMKLYLVPPYEWMPLEEE